MSSLNIPTPDQINLEIPEALLEVDNGLNFDLIKDKRVVGLIGYARSGKDTVADYLSNNYGYKKVKFGDILKHTLNAYFKESVLEDLKNRNVPISFSEIDFLVEDDNVLKEKLRPYMIWLGETLRKRNGVHYWMNKAFKKCSENNKIVIADIRRDDELDLFRGNRHTAQKLYNSRGAASILSKEEIEDFQNTGFKFETNLYHVNQYELYDKDEFTVNTLLKAISEWLIEDTVYIDSRIPDEGESRSKYLESVCKRLAGKHNL